MKSQEKKKFRFRGIIILISWSVIALFFASRSIALYMNRGLPYEQWSFGVLTEVVYWLIWAPLTPLIFRFAGRFPIDRKKWLGRGVLVLFFGIFITFFQISLEITANLIIIPRLFGIPAEAVERIGSIGRIILLESFTGILTYTVVIGSYYAYDYYRKYRERDLQAKQLEGMLAQSELRNLKMQLHPHFLFNTLHTISVLMNKDTESANQMLIRLGELLRMSLENVGVQEVSLKEELEFLEKYLEIEQTRFRDRLKVKVEVEPDILDALVPSLILQPLAENAVRHGISRLIGSGVIEITGRYEKENGMIRLEVRDNGPGIKFDKDGNIVEGVGLSATRVRLTQLYGERRHFEVRNIPGGVSAVVTIPFRAGRIEISENGK